MGSPPPESEPFLPAGTWGRAARWSTPSTSTPPTSSPVRPSAWSWPSCCRAPATPPCECPRARGGGAQGWGHHHRWPPPRLIPASLQPSAQALPQIHPGTQRPRSQPGQAAPSRCFFFFFPFTHCGGGVSATTPCPDPPRPPHRRRGQLPGRGGAAETGARGLGAGQRQLFGVVGGEAEGRPPSRRKHPAHGHLQRQSQPPQPGLPGRLRVRKKRGAQRSWGGGRRASGVPGGGHRWDPHPRPLAGSWGCTSPSCW